VAGGAGGVQHDREEAVRAREPRGVGRVELRPAGEGREGRGVARGPARAVEEVGGAEEDADGRDRAAVPPEALERLPAAPRRAVSGVACARSGVVARREGAWASSRAWAVPTPRVESEQR
jgi:hypothetical protein